MLDDGSYTAVLDRIEEEQAVLVLERDGRAVDDLVVDLDVLPVDGRAPDTVLSVVVEHGTLVSATADPSETDDRRARAQSRFERLARRLPRQGEPADEAAVDTEQAEQAATEESEDVADVDEAKDVADADANAKADADTDDATTQSDESEHTDQSGDDRHE